MKVNWEKLQNVIEDAIMSQYISTPPSAYVVKANIIRKAIQKNRDILFKENK